MYNLHNFTRRFIAELTDMLSHLPINPTIKHDTNQVHLEFNYPDINRKVKITFIISEVRINTGTFLECIKTTIEVIGHSSQGGSLQYRGLTESLYLQPFITTHILPLFLDGEFISVYKRLDN